MTLTVEQVKDIIFEALYPPYEKKFGIKRGANFYNISTLVYGSNAYLYYMRKNEEEAKERKHNHHLLRGAAIDRHIKASMSQEWSSGDEAYLRWVIPFQWKNKKNLRDIVLIGHYDERHVVHNVVLEVKAPEVIDNFVKKGGLSRAKRQAGTYAQILTMKTGKPHQAFIVLIDHDIVVFEVTREEQIAGFDFVKKAAIQVAQMLDKPEEAHLSSASTQNIVVKT
jgi:hypothetical protein